MSSVMRSVLFLCSILFILVFSCKTDSETSRVETSTNAQSSKLITKKEIENLAYNDYLLSADASGAVSDWQKYQELNNQIDYLKNADLSFLKNDLTTVTIFLNDLNLELPKRLDTNEINSRIKALETKMLKANSLLLLDNISKKEQLESLKEVFVAFSNFNLQINKKLEFEANNIQKPN